MIYIEKLKVAIIGNAVEIILVYCFVLVCWLDKTIKPVFKLLNTNEKSIFDDWLFFSLYEEYKKILYKLQFSASMIYIQCIPYCCIL
jgi:hypothetical protein